MTHIAFQVVTTLSAWMPIPSVNKIRHCVDTMIQLLLFPHGNKIIARRQYNNCDIHIFKSTKQYKQAMQRLYRKFIKPLLQDHWRYEQILLSAILLHMYANNIAHYMKLCLINYTKLFLRWQIYVYITWQQYRIGTLLRKLHYSPYISYYIETDSSNISLNKISTW